jgi:hypothetical protein
MLPRTLGDGHECVDTLLSAGVFSSNHELPSSVRCVHMVNGAFHDYWPADTDESDITDPKLLSGPG